VVLRTSAIRAFTSLVTSAAAGGLVSGNRIVPVDISTPRRSSANLRRIAAVIGYRLVCCLNPA